VSWRVTSPCGAAPHTQHKLDDQLLRAVATVAHGLRQSAGGEGGVKTHMIQHAFDQRHATPGSDFVVRKSQFEAHENLALEK